jgi:hypothetical protein
MILPRQRELAGPVQGGLHAVANNLEAMPAVGSYRGVEQLEMAVDRETHRRLVLLPERGAAFDIGKEEGDGAAGQVAHADSRGCVGAAGLGEIVTYRCSTVRGRLCAPSGQRAHRHWRCASRALGG